MKQFPVWVMNLVYLLLGLTFITMFCIVDSNLDTINKYEELLNTQRQKYTVLENQYKLLRKDIQQTELENDYLMEVHGRPLPTYSFTSEEVLLLAKTAQTEAGASAPTAIKYVTQVILNRVVSPYFPDTITEVVYQKTGEVPQFSVAYNGMIDECEVTPETLIAVQEVLLYGVDLPPYVEFFYEKSVQDNWVNTLPVYCTVDGTTFAYSERSKTDYEN